MRTMLKPIAATLMLALGTATAALAQHTVVGRVVDTNDVPLVGVTVIVKGSQSGTATGSNGNYSIQAREEQTLVFSSRAWIE